MQLVKTWEELCELKGFDPVKILPDASMYPEEHRKAVIAQAKLFIIADVINDGYKFNWDDYNEYKWFNYFYMDRASGSAFRFYYCGYYDRDSPVGSRLCFKTEKKAQHVAKYFLELYRDWMEY